VGVSDEGRLRIRESTAPARSIVRGEGIRNYPLLVNAPDRLTVPRNNDVILWQSSLLRGHESHQRPAVRVLLLNF